MEEEQLISRTEAARVLGVTPRTVNRYAAAGRLEPVYVRVRGQMVPRYRVPQVLAIYTESLAPKEVCT